MKISIFTISTTFLMLLSACGNSSETTKIAGAVAAPAVEKVNVQGPAFVPENKLVSGRKNKFSADLNGDGLDDSIFIVDTASAKRSISPDIKVVHPWKYYGDGAVPTDASQGSKIAFYIQINSASSKKTNYLIADLNSPSVLDTDAASELTINKLTSIEAEDARQLKKHARGDVVVIPTEAGIDTYLYWNGSNFVIYEPAVEP